MERECKICTKVEGDRWGVHQDIGIMQLMMWMRFSPRKNSFLIWGRGRGTSGGEG